MKIVEMRATPVAMADPPLLSSYGLHAPYALRTVVEHVGEDGITGAAETHGGERTLVHFGRARDAVVGRDAYDLARLRRDVDRAFTGSRGDPGPNRATNLPQQTYTLPGEGGADVALRVAAALEVAALDLIGKATGRPVCDLLGGRVRDEVHFSAYLFYKRAGGAAMARTRGGTGGARRSHPRGSSSRRGG